MSEHLHHRLAVLQQNLLHGKLPRGLNWTDAVELIEHLGQVQPHGGEEFVFVVGTQREFFKRPHTHELGIEEVSRLRKFLKEAAAGAAPQGSVQQGRMVVLIDHDAAHIYEGRNGSPPLEEVTVTPYDPHGFHRHLIHRKEAHYQGERLPEETSFYDEVAKTLAAASEISLIGHGTGKSSAVNFLVDYLKSHHSEVFRLVKAVATVDLSALTEPEREALARRYMVGKPA